MVPPTRGYIRLTHRGTAAPAFNRWQQKIILKQLEKNMIDSASCALLHISYAIKHSEKMHYLQLAGA
jgi:hypothetical protein